MVSYMSRKIRNIIWEVDLPRPLSRPSVHLDLGSGYSPRNPFNCEKLIALDIFDFQGNQEGFDYVKADLTKRLPFADESFSSVSAYDVLEYVPRWERSDGQIHFPFIELMN